MVPAVLRKARLGVKRLRRRVQSWVLVRAVRAALWALQHRSLEQAVSLGERLGALAYWLSPKLRRLALEHLELAFGDELSPQARERIARACFANAGRLFCEVARMDEIRQRRDELFTLVGEDNLRAILSRGTGCIAITGHIGNWELLAAYFAWRGIPVSAVARRVYVPELNELIVGWRQRQGVCTILRESPSSARAILRVLRDNGILAMVIDQDTHVPSVSVPFFGRPARTPVAAAALALRRGLPVAPVFIQRTGNVGWRVTVCPPIVPEPRQDRREALREVVAEMNRIIEAQIRANPVEWPWWHRRWRRAPMPKLDLDGAVGYEGTHGF